MPQPLAAQGAALGSRSGAFSAPLLTALHGSEAKSALLPSALLWPTSKKGDSGISNSPAATRKMENRNKWGRGRHGCQLGSVRRSGARPVCEEPARPLQAPTGAARPLPRAGPAVPVPPRLSEPGSATGSGAAVAPNRLLGSRPGPRGTGGSRAPAVGVWGCTLTGPGPGLGAAEQHGPVLDCGGVGTSARDPHHLAGIRLC